MPTRRFVTSGLLASAASLLTGCGGSLLSGPGGMDGGSNGGVETASKWQPGGFGGQFQAARPLHKKRTTPATIAELMAPASSFREMSLGNPKAKVTVIEYFSLTCPVCHRFHQNVWPAFKKRYIDSGKIYFIAREFPIGHTSGHASIALRCVDEKNFFPLMRHFLLEQKRWVSLQVRLDAIQKVAAPYGLSMARFNACIADKKLVGEIQKIKQRGRFLGVIGTPTFFINGRQLRGNVSLAEISAVIDPQLG